MSVCDVVVVVVVVVVDDDDDVIERDEGRCSQRRQQVNNLISFGRILIAYPAATPYTRKHTVSTL